MVEPADDPTGLVVVELVVRWSRRIMRLSPRGRLLRYAWEQAVAAAAAHRLSAIRRQAAPQPLKLLARREVDEAAMQSYLSTMEILRKPPTPPWVVVVVPK